MDDSFLLLVWFFLGLSQLYGIRISIALGAIALLMWAAAKERARKTEGAEPTKIGKGTWVLAGIAIIYFLFSLLLQGERLY